MESGRSQARCFQVDAAFQMDRFTLLRGQWYGLSMYPGYGDCPYHSPILVRSIESLGDRRFELAFWNLCYALGVQDFTMQLRTLRRGPSHLVASGPEVEDRTYVLVHFNPRWLQRHFPQLDAAQFFDTAGHPDDQALLATNCY